MPCAWLWTKSKQDGSKNDEMRQERGLKLFLLIPRMLLHPQPRGGTIPPREAGTTFREVLFRPVELIRIGVVNEEEAMNIARRRSRRQGQDGVVRRAERADPIGSSG